MSEMTKTNTTKRAHPHQKKVLTEILGWYGVSAILLAYILVSMSLIDVHGILYSLLNLTGALGVLLVATAKHVKQSMVINAFWALMAVVALVGIFIRGQ